MDISYTHERILKIQLVADGKADPIRIASNRDGDVNIDPHRLLDIGDDFTRKEQRARVLARSYAAVRPKEIIGESFRARVRSRDGISPQRSRP